MDDLLDFSSDIGEGDDEDEKPKAPPSSSSIQSNADDPSRSLPECVEEEELEWLSNKDAFPAVETFVDIFPVAPSNFSMDLVKPSNVLKDRSPVSVLENSNSSSCSNSNNSSAIMSCCGGFSVPVCRRARSKRQIKRKRSFSGNQQWWCVASSKNTSDTMTTTYINTGCIIGRKCTHCHANKTPQWRAGPMGPKTLCNACGVRYKSGRLVPEYRPASSPTYSSRMHSNSHRKIMEMRRQKEYNVVVMKPVDQG